MRDEIRRTIKESAEKGSGLLNDPALNTLLAIWTTNTLLCEILIELKSEE